MLYQICRYPIERVQAAFVLFELGWYRQFPLGRTISTNQANGGDWNASDFRPMNGQQYQSVLRGKACCNCELSQGNAGCIEFFYEGVE
jgi:hypothetical protein